MVRRRANGNPIRLLVQISAELEKGGFLFCDVKGIFPIETVVFERFLCLDFDASSASVILSTLNEVHPSLISTIELGVAHYVGFTSRHFHRRVQEHKRSKFGNHVQDEHGKDPETIERNFKILKKFQSKLDCLILKFFLFPNLDQNCTNVVIRSVQNYLLNRFTLSLFLSP